MKESVSIGNNEVASYRRKTKQKNTESTIFIFRFPRVCNHLACERLFSISINERLGMQPREPITAWCVTHSVGFRGIYAIV